MSVEVMKTKEQKGQRRMNRPAYATESQIGYLKRLMNRATVLRVETVYIRDWDRMLMREASDLINEIKAKVEAAEAARMAR
jgi:hypothetical protein